MNVHVRRRTQSWLAVAAHFIAGGFVAKTMIALLDDDHFVVAAVLLVAWIVASLFLFGMLQTDDIAA